MLRISRNLRGGTALELVCEGEEGFNSLLSVWKEKQIVDDFLEAAGQHLTSILKQ